MAPEPLNLDLALCRKRQQRVLELMQVRGVDRLVVTRPEHVQYLTGFRPLYLMTAVVCLNADGQVLLVAPNVCPPHCAADEVLTYAAQLHSTLRQEQHLAAAECLQQVLSGNAVAQLGVDGSRFGLHALRAAGVLTISVDDVTDLEPELWQLRRRKDQDELALMRRAIECTDAMYQRAREIIEPGINELELFGELHAVAVKVAGEPLSAPLGNDYQCNSQGGPPRNRVAAAGELYILDIGPCYRGYYADNCRTISVDRNPTSSQMQAWEAILPVFEMIQRDVRPGVHAKGIFEEASRILAECPHGEFPHHLGHGVGLYPHEAPHLNPFWDDCFQEGDVFTVEPGLYSDLLAHGLRLEKNYLVTANGVELLTPFPLELTS
ncbi:MAG: Xaa-Pro peptidase family protein [Pseudomonadales bacterium]|nr:Xaa-Pro peptidase family protein [Pseudomonadales bacterium]